MTARGYATGVLLAALGAVCWSTGGALVRLTEGIDAWQIIFYRSITHLVCMLVWLSSIHGRRLPGLMLQAGWNAVIAGVAVGTAGMSFVASLFYTTVAQSIFMVGLSPFLSAALGIWILRERVDPVTWLAMAVALAGMAVILVGSAGGASVPGIALAVYSAFCFSCYSVLLRWGQNTEMSVALIWNALILIAASLAMLLLPTGLRQPHGFPELAIGWWNLSMVVIMGAVQLTLGLVLFTFGSRRVPAGQLALIALIEPTLSPLWAWLVANELPPWPTFAGGAVILSAIAVQALFSARGRPAQAASRRPAARARLS